MKILTVPAIVAGLVFGASSANAASFSFSYTYDGTSVSQDAGSDTADGTSLSVGDDFTLDITTAGSDFWQVDAAYLDFLTLTYSLQDGAIRTGNTVSQFFLNGALVETISELSVRQLSIHIGSQEWNLGAGLQFDQILLSYEFLSIDNMADTIISETSEVFGTFSQNDLPFFNHPDISYQTGVPAVPLPASLPLLAFALGGMGLMVRKKRNA